MKTAVWDTYVKKGDGSVLHFDIIVPEDVKDEKQILKYGYEYLISKNVTGVSLDLRQCRFCHLEELKPEWKEAIHRNGYYILEMEEIPAQLPENPTRRAMILHLRGHHDQYRFADFSGKSEDEVWEMIHDLTTF